MINFKKDYKLLVKCYNKKLKQLHTKNFTNLNNNMEYFVTYLKFMRDYYILTESLVIDDHENLKVQAAATAIAEYDAYKNCIHKYFDKEGKILETLPKEFTKQEVLDRYATEKNFHWNCFWKLVTLNMESWMSPDAAV